MKKKERMRLCRCGSGTKYKNCCLPKNRPQDIFFKKDTIMSFFGSIKTSSDNRSSMEIHDASFTVDGEKTTLIDDKLTLSANSIKEESETKRQRSVILKIPTKNTLQSQITIEGNASAVNESTHHNIEPLINDEQVVCSKNGVKARIKIDRQRDEGFDYFDVLFLIGKLHPHIALRPDGNGNYIGFREFDCKLKSILNYNPAEKTISPSQISIDVTNISEKLIINFEFNFTLKTVKLVSANFI